MKAKVVFIAHPISGDVKGNLEKIANIIRNINILRDNVIPFAPYFSDCVALNDKNKWERERGIKNTEYFFRLGIIDGDVITNGMKSEILLAKELNIPIIPQSVSISNEMVREVLNGR